MVKVKTSILTLIFLAALLVLIAATPWGGEKDGSIGFEPREGARVPESDIGGIGVEIFTLYLVPFEVLSLVLLAALIGAIYVARKELPR